MGDRDDVHRPADGAVAKHPNRRIPGTCPLLGSPNARVPGLFEGATTHSLIQGVVPNLKIYKGDW